MKNKVESEIKLKKTLMNTKVLKISGICLMIIYTNVL